MRISACSAIGVLILVHQDLVELRAHVRRERRIRGHRMPVQQQIVVVQRLVGELALDIGAKQPREFLLPGCTPREHVPQRIGQRSPGIDPVRINGKTSVLARKTLLGSGQVQLMAHHVHQVGRIAPVEHAEIGIEADAGGMAPDQPLGDGMEGPRPGQLHRNLCGPGATLCACFLAEHRSDDEQRPGAKGPVLVAGAEAGRLALRGVQSFECGYGRHARHYRRKLGIYPVVPEMP